MDFHTPLRYPGGKGRLAQCVADIMQLNRLTGGHYVEPYAGGAGVALTLLNLEHASHVHINDINKSVHAFWRSALDQPEELCRLISSKRVSMAEWRRQKAVQQDRDASQLELGYSTFFLNRTNRSGIIGAGVIGGQKQDGAWKLDARFNKKDLIGRVERIATLSSRISLYNLDTVILLKKVIPELPSRSLIYLDPPYYVKGKGLYENHYSHEDHIEVARLVAKLNHPWIVSYDNVSAIRDMYGAFRNRVFGLRYSAQTRYEGSEVMYFSDGMKIPDRILPSRARAA